MPTDFYNLNFLDTFVRNLSDLPNSSREAADRLADEIESIVRTRVDSGIFLGGEKKNEGYSMNPIKAYKLGTAVVTGYGIDKRLIIDGKTIADEDWYWGEWDKQQKGFPDTGKQGYESFGESYSGKPAPVFIPGYLGWRTRYNGLGSEVDLNFHGNMLDNFAIDVFKGRGSNQYGGQYELDFTVNSPYGAIAGYTDYYREWLTITEDELNEAITRSGASLTGILFK